MPSRAKIAVPKKMGSSDQLEKFGTSLMVGRSPRI